MGLNPTAFMDFHLLCCVNGGLRDGFIIFSEESYRMCLSNCLWSWNLKKCCGLGLIWAVAWQRKIVTLIWRDNVKYVLEEQVVMMVGLIKTVLVLGRYFWSNILNTAGKICKLVPLSRILSTLINFQFVLLAVSRLHLGDTACHFYSTCWAL